MILNCPSCRAKYLVQIGLFARGGRQVRCARCKYEWHATLPTHIDVFKGIEEPVPSLSATPELPPPIFSQLSRAPANAAPPGVAQASRPSPEPTPNLPATIPSGKLHQLVAKLKLRLPLIGKVTAAIFIALLWPILDRQQIVVVFPSLRSSYRMLGFEINHSGAGLIFQDVKSELRYDSGTMKLNVDGVIHNVTKDMQFIPEIKARAIGADRAVIQSWSVAPPSATVAAGSDVSFHTETDAPMQHTIEEVSLEFSSQEETK